MSTGFASYQAAMRVTAPVDDYWISDPNQHQVLGAGSYRDLLPLIRSWQPDLVVRDTSERGSPLAAQRAGVPCVDLLSCANAALSAIRRRETRYLAEIADALGDAWDGSSVRLPDTVMAFGPPEFFGLDTLKVPARYFRYDPSKHRMSPKVPVPGPRDHDSSRAVVSFGTTIEGSSATFAAIVGGLLDAGFGQVTVRSQDTDILRRVGSRAGDVELHAHLDLPAELADADLFVCHGSATSTMEALYYGCPPLIVPQHNDNFFVAETCARNGIAGTLPKDAVTARAVRETASGMMADAGLHRRIASFRAANEALPGETELLEFLETVGIQSTAG
ncbi:glycosyltransferase [Nocardia sp. Marseille-Q1738]